MIRKPFPVISTLTVLAMLAASASVSATSAAAEGAATVDIVVLENGNEFVGRIRRHTDERLELEVEQGTVTFKSSDVREVRRNVSVPDTPEKETAGSPRSESADELVGRLGSADRAARTEARRALSDMGADAVPALAAALASQNGTLRTEAALLLGELRSRSAVRPMLVALRSAVEEDGTVPLWQAGFAQALREGLRLVTEKDFADVREWLAWWEGELGDGRPADGPAPLGAYLDWDTPQVGTLPAPGKSPDRDWILWQMNRVGSARYSYLPPVQSPVLSR